MDYVRYAADFLIGIAGSKEFSCEIRSIIDQFVKGDLHLEIKKNNIVNNNEDAVKFLGFAIYLPMFRKKTKPDRKSIASVQKYKQRVVSRLRHNNATLANRQVNLIKANWIGIYRKITERLSLNSDNINYRQISKSLVLKLIQDEFTTSQIFNFSLNMNKTMKQWETHFRNLFISNMKRDLLYDKKNISDAIIPDISGDLVTNRLKEARDRFLKEISEIEELLIFQKKDEACGKYIKKYNSHVTKSKARFNALVLQSSVHEYPDVLVNE
jgi:hypothetical protein